MGAVFHFRSCVCGSAGTCAEELAAGQAVEDKTNRAHEFYLDRLQRCGALVALGTREEIRMNVVAVTL